MNIAVANKFCFAVEVAVATGGGGEGGCAGGVGGGCGGGRVVAKRSSRSMLQLRLLLLILVGSPSTNPEELEVSQLHGSIL